MRTEIATHHPAPAWTTEPRAVRCCSKAPRCHQNAATFWIPCVRLRPLSRSQHHPLPRTLTRISSFEDMSALTTTAGPCAATASCTASGKGDVTYWAEKAYSEEDKTGTVVVVQVINTVLDTTSYSTIANKVPSNYVPPPTNAAGTKIASVTFSRHGTLSTTTMYVLPSSPVCPLPALLTTRSQRLPHSLPHISRRLHRCRHLPTRQLLRSKVHLWRKQDL